MSTASARQESEVRIARLDNGLEVLIQEVHTAPLASVWCWYRVGPKDETSGLTGVSHWVEHMNFKGTTNIPREQMKSLVERFGGTWNGYTWLDQTTYFETATREALDRMLFLEAERMVNAVYDPQDCESERTVIISELEGGENDPDQLLDTEVTAAAFKAHSYRHPTIGWLSDLQTMTRDDLYAYYRRYYVPSNATLVVVGDVDADDTLRAIDGHFGRLPPGSAAPRRYSAEPPQAGERRVVLRKQGTTAYLKLAFHAPAVTHADFFPMLVLDAVLTGAKGLNLWVSYRGTAPQRSARLYRALVDRGIASVVCGALMPTEQPFLYTVSLTASAGTSLRVLEDAALEEIDKARSDGITGGELAKAKKQLHARLVFESDSVTHIAHQLGFFQIVASVDLNTTMVDRIAAVTLDQVGRAAETYLTADNRTVGWFDPPAPGKGFPGRQVSEMYHLEIKN